jgi:hypothetical protein
MSFTRRIFSAITCGLKAPISFMDFLLKEYAPFG